ncbi:MAG TPA: 3-isopropylmalate dehydratase small subunit, partial [Deltaproteobacteria bacterium]|nr:3-isopropylmalate dehydratase small subunit [Deltaproteobacteria bacterium]
REHAPLAIKFAGIGVVIAKSFARIFYRNAFNIGLPILESPEAGDLFEEADPIQVDIASGKIMGARNGQVLSAKPIPDFMRSIIDAGGLVAYTKKNRSVSERE